MYMLLLFALPSHFARLAASIKEAAVAVRGDFALVPSEQVHVWLHTRDYLGNV